jgi:hypothetical protein
VSTRLRKDLGTWRFWRHFGHSAFAAIGFFAAIVGLVGLLFPGVIADREGWLAAGIGLVAICYGTYCAWPTPIEATYTSPNMQVRVIEGDLFDQPGHLVIGMCDTFDTAIPSIIAKQSVQGQFLERIFASDIGELDQSLMNALSGIQPAGDIAKSGKTKKYPLGTVAVIREHARCYFCLAYTTMNEANEARGTIDGIWRSLDSLWKSISAHGNGQPVSMPVIGGGQARLSQVLPAQDSIRFMALSFVLSSRVEKICDELVIVVRPAEYEKLDRLELQAFLGSLRPS